MPENLFAYRLHEIPPSNQEEERALVCNFGTVVGYTRLPIDVESEEIHATPVYEENRRMRHVNQLKRSARWSNATSSNLSTYKIIDHRNRP